MALHRLPIVGLCGGGGKLPPERAKLAQDIGALIGQLGAHLFISASFAVAEAAAKGFLSVSPRGITLSDIARNAVGELDKASCAPDGTPYSSRCAELAMFTRVDDLERPRTQDRSRVNLLTCDAVVALPGSAGTRIEAAMTGTVRGMNRTPQLPVLLVGPAEEFPKELRDLYARAPDAAAADALLCLLLSRQGFFLIRRRHEQPA